MAHLRYDNHRPAEYRREDLGDTYTAYDMDTDYQTIKIEPAPRPVRRNNDRRPASQQTHYPQSRPVQSQAVTVRYEDNVVEATMQDYDYRQYPSTTAKITAPADAGQKLRLRPVVVDGVPVNAQNRIQRRFWTFRNKAIAILAAGALAALAIFAPGQIAHYHAGDYPAHHYVVSIRGEKCDVVATYNSSGNLNTPGNIDIYITPASFKSKLHPVVEVGQWKPGALNNGPTHDVTLEVDRDMNADGRTDIVVYVDGEQAGVLFADQDGGGYHWSK